MDGVWWAGKGRSLFCCAYAHVGSSAACTRCLQVLHLVANVGPGEDGGGGGLIEVEGGVAGEGEARFHPMGKVRKFVARVPIICYLS